MTAAEYLRADEIARLTGVSVRTARRRDMISSINRICEMAGRSPSDAPAEASAIRAELRKIRPAKFGVSAKTFSNQRSLLAAALRLAGALDDMERGLARRHPVWGPLLRALGADTQLDDGLAAFANWCAGNEIAPDAVTDDCVKLFAIWLETRTHCLKPHDVVRRTPLLWNQAGAMVDGWPKIRLSPVSFRAPSKRLAWDDLSEGFRRDAAAYLARRADPDIFDEAAAAPRRPLAPTTMRLQRTHLRLAASVLIEAGSAVAAIASLADLVERERFKAILRHYHGEGNGKPSAFAVGIAKTLIQAAKHHVGASAEQVAHLKALAAKLPAVPFDLTTKNKALLRQLEFGAAPRQSSVFARNLAHQGRFGTGDVSAALRRGADRDCDRPSIGLRSAPRESQRFTLATPLFGAGWAERPIAAAHSRRRDQDQKSGFDGRNSGRCRTAAALVSTSHPAAR